MADRFEYYLDVMPGETRGIVARDGVCHQLLIERATDPLAHRLGTRLVGRVTRVEPGIRAAFIDIGTGEISGFLPMGKALRLDVGAKIEVLVTNEPRENKGPLLRYLGVATGDVRVLEAGPDVKSRLSQLANGQPIVTGLEALRMGLQAEEEGMASGVIRAEVGLDLCIERTRALIAVDIDYAPQPGKDSRRARDSVNWLGLEETARLLTLKAWGGIIAIDLAGVHLQAESINSALRTIFGKNDGAIIGPLSRFGVVQLSLPWSVRPLDERINMPENGALAALRRLNEALLSQTSIAVWVLQCDPQWLAYLTPLIHQLGPRAKIIQGAPGRFTISEG